MGTSRREFLLMSSAAGLAASFGLAPYKVLAQDSGRIVLATAARAPVTLDPYRSASTTGDTWAIYHLYSSLVGPADGAFGLTPDDFLPLLAESYDTSADAMTWTYRLRHGVQFHKGYGELTAEDVLFTFGRILDPEIIVPDKVLFAVIDSVEAPDPYTVVFTLKQPDPLFNAIISKTTGVILSRKAYEEKGEAYNFDPIGTGPYQLESVSDTDGVVLVANPDYFGEKPATERLHITYVADTTARTLAFASGQVDMMEGVRAPGWVDTMLQRDPNTVFDTTEPGASVFLFLNLTRKPLDDLRIRQAFRYAINNEQIAAAYQGIATPMVGITAPPFPGAVHRETLPEELRYDYDPERARALVAEAGFPDGVTIPCYTSQREDYAAIMLMIQEQLRAANIHLDLSIIDHSTMHAQNAQDMNALTLYITSLPPVPTRAFVSHLVSASDVKPTGDGGVNYAHYGVAIPGVDDLIDKAMVEANFETQVALVEEAERRVLTDLPMLGIVTLSAILARNPRVDLGYDLHSGYAYWSLAKARRV
ncbi:ABC transporter substrate-binding protein [Devosia ginsengisoli]|uniref:ABC transporter substrate-binding protein n=1 Tax=Devosia ginsengisoli TaxID=400770 RepID=UPI0026F06352|nr:ABC transporter substrate-binding protein [Devosia ginsengisoli]MCR6671867.1 ABC transporter substrate-binding protein [Devosia ginsengisoli]